MLFSLFLIMRGPKRNASPALGAMYVDGGEEGWQGGEGERYSASRCTLCVCSNGNVKSRMYEL